MKITGLIGGSHSSGIASLVDGKPYFALEEERHCRVKSWKDFWDKTFRFPYNAGLIVPNEFPEFDWNDQDYITGFVDNDRFKVLWENMGLGPWDPHKHKYEQINHHRAHCSLAYYLSGFQDDTLVISMDAGGDKYWSRSFIGKKGEMHPLGYNTLKTKSLGHYYAMLTEFLGFKRLKDEGKVVGLASHGQYVEWIYNIFDSCVTIDKKGQTEEDLSITKIYQDFYQLFYNPNYNPAIHLGPHGYKKADIAYNGQLVFEKKVIELIEYYRSQSPNIKNLALAGGVFANVKLNKSLNELEWVNEIFIAPPMGDEGLALGCTLAVHKKYNPNFKPFKINDIFLGSLNTKEKIYYDENRFIERPYNEEEIAHDLKEGKIIGWFNGRYEHGPRALCNRSIIANPSIPGTYKKINDKLQRNDNMPFAPVVIDKYAKDVFNVTKSEYTAEFMTMLYDTKEEWYDKIPAVVHPIDKTARIQIINKNSNPKFYSLINHFYDTSGIPVLLNTSFNVHGEPIVCHPKEAFVHLYNNIVDKLIINNKTYTKR